MVSFLLTVALHAPQTGSQALPKPAPLTLTNPIRDKNFYLLALIHRDRELVKTLRADRDLKAVADEAGAALKQAFDAANAVPALSAAELTDAQIERAAAALRRLTISSAKVRAFVHGPLRQSGAYQRYAAQSDPELLASAWRDCAKGIDSVIEVYGSQTKGARSQAIDSPLYTPKNPLYPLLVHTILAAILDANRRADLFFDPGLELADHLLLAQLRDEAGRHEPMEQGVNKAAFRQVKKTPFAAYPYTVIVVPGEGPEESNVALSPAGRLRLELAVHRYRAKKAPFILVSGGYVHPNMTPYSEAIEMKRCLMRDFGVPERAIIVDPHARHTTTNLRNAARLIYRYGIPFNRPGLIVSDPYQSGYIDSKSLFDRNQSVFGFQPVTSYKRLSPYDVEFKPALISLSMDPADPLDP